ncbi:MAG TPA: hypothetical protein VF179_24275 [Thermoanaerobaculia bacterium]|nr:hypothetical protein [Thermoanaerobaculia bacterium]
MADAGKYLRAGAPSIEPWTGNAVGHALQGLFFRTSYTELCVRAPALLRETEEQIARAIDEIGYRAEVRLEIAGLREFQVSQRIDHPFLLEVRGAAERLGVECGLLLEIVDAARYDEAGAPALDSWARTAIEQILGAAFFEKSLTQLYRERENLVAAIAAELQEQAEVIGHRARATVSIPGLDALQIPVAMSLKHRTDRQVRHHTTPLELCGEISLQLAEAERYIASGQPDLAAWWRQRLEETAGAVLFGLTYTELCLRYQDKREQLARQLRTAAGAIGYAAEVQVEVLGINPESIKFQRLIHQFPVLLPNSAEELEVKAEILVELQDPELLLAADLADVPAWIRRELAAITGKILAGHTLSELSVLGRATAEKIEQELAGQVAVIGYAATTHLTMPGLDSEVLKPRLVAHSFPCRLNGYSEIKVTSELLLQVDNPEVYLSQGCPDLEGWAKRQIEDIARDYLLVIGYTDLCIELDNHKARIKDQVEKAASSIGCKVKQLITLTDLFLERLPTGLVIELEGDFPSKLQSVSVGLCLKAEVRILNLHPLRETLEKYPDFVAHMESSVRRRIEQTLRGIDPAVFYTEFEEPNASGTEPISRDIEEEVRRVLEGEEFRAEVLDLRCWQKETELSEALRKLIRGLHSFTVDLERLGGEPSLRFNGTLRVEGIDSTGWHTFHRTVPDWEGLIKQTVEHLKALLADVSLEVLLWTPSSQLQAQITKLLQERLINDFGLKVSLSNWQRLPTGIEILMRDAKAASWSGDLEDVTRLSKLIRTLKEDLYNTIRNGLGTQQTEDLRARIRALEEERDSLMTGPQVQSSRQLEVAADVRGTLAGGATAHESGERLALPSKPLEATDR